jgi:hypothetical protein
METIPAPVAQFCTLALHLTSFHAAGLAPLFHIRVDSEYDYTTDTTSLHVHALLGLINRSEDAEIDAMRAWATAVSGHLHLGEPQPDVLQKYTLRWLRVVGQLPGVGQLEIRTDIAKTPIPQPATA